jgi:iron transport multicopper oxidase
MALRAALRVLAAFFALGRIALTIAGTVTYDFDISWLQASFDGFTRAVIGVNGAWPPPTITANLGDTVVVNVVNSLGNQSTSLHFHGLFMNGTSDQDGTAQVVQCPIAPGSSYTYTFQASQVGSYWYHSHVKGQYPDGLRAPLIIRDPESPFRDSYDEELVLTLSDWYHDEMAVLIPHYLNDGGMMSAEPVPDAALINDTQSFQAQILPEKTYLVRLLNLGAFAGQYFWIEGHSLRIVEVDGVYTKPQETEMIFLSSGQRCSFLLTTQLDRGANYPIVASMDPVRYSTQWDAVYL